MPKRRKAAPEENSASEAGEEQVETRRTRSGRAVRAPSSQVPVRTPGRRTRRSELPAAEEQNTESPERRPESPVKKSSLSSEPEPAEPPKEDEEGSTAGTDPNLQMPRPAPAETVPEGSEPIPKKKPALEPTKPIPLGKPKSGRVWKDRNKQR